MMSCATESRRPVDSFSAFNMLGGASRGNDFTAFAPAPVSSLNPDRFDSLKGGFLGPPLVLPDGRMAVVAGGGKLALIRYRTLERVIPFAEGDLPMPGLAADAAGRIYALTTGGSLRALDSAGGPLWSHPLEPAGASSGVYYAPPLALDQGVVVGSTRGALRRFDGAGARSWEIVRGAAIGPMIAGDPGLGLVVPVTFSDYAKTDTLLAVDPANGRARWARPIDGARILYGPVIARDMILVGCVSRDSMEDRHPFVAAFAPDGRPLWRTPIGVMPRGISVDDQGNVYVAGSGVGRTFIGGEVLSLDRAGRSRWRVTLESGVPAAPVITKEWIYFVSRRDGRTGLFTYDRNGRFAKFLDLSLVPDVQAQGTISADGVLLFAGLDLPAILKGAGEGSGLPF